MTRPTPKISAIAALMLGTATPALAQDICGGFGNNGQWIGGAEANSDITTAATYQEQMALVLGGNEYVSLFTLSAPTDIRVEAAGRGSGDPIIDLLDSSGGIILSDDDSGGNAASRAETSLDAGTYCMSVRSYDGGPMTAFVRIGRQEQEPLTDGISAPANTQTGSCDTAVPFGTLGESVSASAADVPFWSFELDGQTPITITAENETADPVITLYAPGETYIDENDDYDGLNSRLDVTDTLAAGTYCLGVTALSDDSAPITLSINPYDADEALQALYARGEAAPPLDGSVPVTDLGVLTSRTRQDVQATEDVTWFSFDFEGAGLLVVEAIANGNSDPWLVLYDDLGRQVGLNDDYGDGLDSMIAVRLQEGTYIIGVRLFDGSQGFVRLVAEKYVRAD
ncbi:ABC transporter substrate-binding protein [Loktanella sp. 5RATIMAR09]|uniref:PPC domain-containing protein n=1 Tax=Loktanella sp. 5RATIMAR09 TaxID=1225655 RepID=UPI0006EBA73D|nr:PPC domain-containing protein [Loktanella sp. 5RATIMAR09]KQI73823.1 ABC transporter substrate-binding protein [Loktanella sp. 5RATIMAR09]